MKHTGKFLAILLTLAMAMGLLAAMAVPASAGTECTKCGGTGLYECFECSGMGYYYRCPDHPGRTAFGPMPCDDCGAAMVLYDPCDNGCTDDGSGFFVAACSKCGGYGQVEAPGITGPQSLFIKQGYAAASSEAFTVTGNPTPTVTVSVKPGDTNNGGKITWNSGTKKLDIAPGLAQGDYRVFLKASSSAGESGEHSFTVTVDPPGGDSPNYIKLWGKTTDYVSNFLNWFLLIVCFGWIWMAF